MFAWLCLTFLAVVGGDQATKVVLCRRVGLNQSIRLGGGVRLHPVANAQRRFGVRSPTTSSLVLWGVATSSGLVMVELVRSVGGGAAAVGIAVAVGGATGNLLDRLVRGHVIDFIEVGLWPIFNVADVGIVTGIAVATAAHLV